ncbi:hypothetical protein Tco_1255685 [Tanacetum coccineum]
MNGGNEEIGDIEESIGLSPNINQANLISKSIASIRQKIKEDIAEAESLEEGTGHLEIEFVVKKLAVELVTRRNPLRLPKGNSLRLQPWRTYALSSIVGLSEPHVPKKKLRVWHSHMDLPSDPNQTIHDCIRSRPKAWILICSEFVIQIMIAEVVPRLSMCSSLRQLSFDYVKTQIQKTQSLSHTSPLSKIFQAVPTLCFGVIPGVQVGGNWEWRLPPRGRALDDISSLISIIGNLVLHTDVAKPETWSWSIDSSGKFKVESVESEQQVVRR